MKIMLLGKNGQIGWELCRTLATVGEVSAYSHTDIDIAREAPLRSLIRTVQPQVIVNAAAYTMVDQAEREPYNAMAVNRDAPAILADEAKHLGAVLIQYSTDYVFDGGKSGLYIENDAPNPLSMYAQSKLEGERAIEDIGGTYLILRTSWVYSLRRTNFLTSVLQWARRQKTLRIVTDQISCPTWCRSIAEATAQVVAVGGLNIRPWLQERRGIYHLACEGYASRLEWAREILKLDPQKEEQAVHDIQPALSHDFPTPALRPEFSALNCNRFYETFGLRLPDWKHALRLAMELP